MKTRSLLKISLITAIIGTFLISILANTVEPNAIKISDINEKMIGEWVKIKGNVTNQRMVGSLTILTVYDGSAGIRAILKKDIENLENFEVIILGKVFEYKDEIEIEISKIEIVK